MSFAIRGFPFRYFAAIAAVTKNLSSAGLNMLLDELLK